MKDINTNNFEIYYTGGGVWIAQYTDAGYLCAVSSDMPTYYTVYHDKGEDTFYPENIVYSADVNETALTTYDTMIYDNLYRLLLQEDAVTVPGSVSSDLSYNEFKAILTAVNHAILTLDMDYNEGLRNDLEQAKNKLVELIKEKL